MPALPPRAWRGGWLSCWPRLGSTSPFFSSIRPGLQPQPSWNPRENYLCKKFVVLQIGRPNLKRMKLFIIAMLPKCSWLPRHLIENMFWNKIVNVVESLVLSWAVQLVISLNYVQATKYCMNMSSYLFFRKVAEYWSGYFTKSLGWTITTQIWICLAPLHKLHPRGKSCHSHLFVFVLNDTLIRLGNRLLWSYGT